MRTVQVTTEDGFGLSAQISGADGPRTLLLLAGQANSHHWWHGLRERFEPGFRVVSFDYRGTGASRGPVTRWSTALFADDAERVLSALGIDTAAVYGTSMGGRVAQLLAARHPQRVGRLVLACTSPGGRHALERSPEVRHSLGDPDPERRLSALHQLFYTEAWPHGPSASALLGDPTMTAQERRAHLRASDGHDAWDELPRIEAPTLVLHGRADLMVPSGNAELIASQIPDATVRLHPLGRHGFFEEFADELQPIIEGFL